MNTVKLSLSTTAIVSLAISSAAAQEAGISPKLNFVFIMTDQQRASLCAREGYPLDVTPFVDKMADQGIWFDRAFTATPASGPRTGSNAYRTFPKSNPGKFEP